MYGDVFVFAAMWPGHRQLSVCTGGDLALREEGTPK